jgi:superfamily II DNA or RNA helicase
MNAPMEASRSVAPRALRPYQIEAADAVEANWADGIWRTGVVLPTGAGKSTVIGELLLRAYRRGQRSIAVAHRGELLDQMRRDFHAVAPDVPTTQTGIVRAEQDDHHCPIVFATLQTLATAHRREALGHRDVLIWDEVHHAGADGFHTTFSELGGYDGARMAGFTATMARAERGRIGLGDVIEKISYERDLAWAIKHGYLVMPHGLTVRIKGLNALNDVRNVAGDFHQTELAEIMEAASTYVVEAIEKHAIDRRSIIFAASVDAAEEISRAINASGKLKADYVTGAMNYESRKPIYDNFRTGAIDCLVTVMVLTEGADFPMCDCVVLARPTRSRNLYSQMIGRSLRLYENKNDALVLDLAGSARNMKLVRLTELLEGVEQTDVDPDGNLIEPEPLEDIGAFEAETKIVRVGPVDMVTIDLLANDDTLWLQTPAGVPFLSLMGAGDVVFLWPQDGRRPSGDEKLKWAVGQINTRRPKIGGWVNETGRYPSDEPVYIDLPDALEAAEVWVVTTEQGLASRNAGWRRNQAPSDKQMNLARNLGIVGYDFMTKARLSDEISITFASRVLDGAMEGTVR